jgi:pathogenesis-related protein 1
VNIYRLIPVLGALLCITPALAQISSTETLAAHNAERQNYPGVAPLQWSDEIAQYAQTWANWLAERDLGGEHRQFTTDNPFAPGQYLGENIYWADGMPGTGPEAVQNWIAEKQWYHYDQDNGYGGWNQPPGCQPPAGKFCGHFTQVIWKNTQYVGCGRAVAQDKTVYIVCNYYTGGNFAGQKPY